LTINNVPPHRNLVDNPRVDPVIETPMIGNPMYKILTACAAAAVTTLVFLPGPANAIERRADGMRNSDQIEVSSQRRYRRYSHTRRYYAQPYYDRPHYAYGYARGPSWGPAPFPFVFGLPY
jgi:hypothetical protein